MYFSICKKNNLNFTDLLQPFGSMLPNFQIRSVNRSSAAQFGVRFQSVTNVRSLDQKQADGYLDTVVRESTPPSLTGDGIEDSRDAERFMKRQSDSHTSWFNSYRKEYLETLRFGPDELMDHPIACMYLFYQSPLLLIILVYF